MSLNASLFNSNIHGNRSVTKHHLLVFLKYNHSVLLSFITQFMFCVFLHFGGRGDDLSVQKKHTKKHMYLEKRQNRMTYQHELLFDFIPITICHVRCFCVCV